MAADPHVAVASGKLLRPDGRTLDSTGIVMPRHRRPRDRGSEQPDHRQYDRAEPVFAVTGAACFLARSEAERSSLPSSWSFFSALSCYGGGLGPLPAWVRRITRVTRWVTAKVALYNARILARIAPS